MTAPLIENPNLGALLSQSFLQSFQLASQRRQAKEQNKFEQQRINQEQARIDLTRSQQALGAQQLARQNQSDATTRLSMLYKINPDFFQTETARGVLTDAGINPDQFITSMGLRQRRTEIFLGRLPESMRGAVGTLISIGDLGDLPADVKTAIFNQLNPQLVGADPKKFSQFMSLWHTGRLTAGASARAVGYLLPPDIPQGLVLDPNLANPDRKKADQLSNLGKTLNAFNTLIDNARPDIDKNRERIFKARGGPLYARFGRFPSPEIEQQANAEFQRWLAATYPQYDRWQRKIAWASEAMDAVANDLALPPDPTRATQDATPGAGDELDELIGAAADSLNIRPRRRATP